MDNINKIFIINLDKDIERLNEAKKQLNKYNITNYERISGINGSKLTEQEKKLITTDVGNILASDSMIGCGISHINLWKRIIDDGIEKCLILEDDFILEDNFINKFNDAYKYCPDNYDLLFLTANPIHNKNLRISNINKYFYKQLFVSQTLAYIITIDGAKKLLNHINKISYHIDVEIGLTALLNQDINIISLKERLVYQIYDMTSYNINNCNYPLIIDKLFEKNNFLNYSYKVVLFSIGGFNINVNILLIILLGYLSIKLSILLIIIEFFLFNDKKINIEVLFYLFIGYLIKVILYGLYY
jgi:GR25 family glycosyltransferase involved in LPS biosynthesis